jgi:hypothetical protein
MTRPRNRVKIDTITKPLTMSKMRLAGRGPKETALLLFSLEIFVETRGVGHVSSSRVEI